MANFLETLMQRQFAPGENFQQMPGLSAQQLDQFLVQQFGMLPPEQMEILRKMYTDEYNKRLQALPPVQKNYQRPDGMNIPYKSIDPDLRYLYQQKKRHKV